MKRAQGQRVFDLFDLTEEEEVSEQSRVPSAPLVVVMFSYNPRTVATPARNGKPKRTHRSILNRLLPWMEKTCGSEVACRQFSGRTDADLTLGRLILVVDFDPSYFEVGGQAEIGALLRRGAKLIGISGTQRGDSAYASFKRGIRGEGFMELADKRIGFVALAELLRRHVRDSIAT